MRLRKKTRGRTDWRCVTPNAALGKAGVSTVLALIRRYHATHKHSVSTCVYSARVLLMCFDVAAVVAWVFVCLFGSGGVCLLGSGVCCLFGSGGVCLVVVVFVW